LPLPLEGTEIHS